MRVTASVLNVRSAPGTSFSVISQLKQGEEVTVVEQSGDWSRVEPCGWVSSMYLASVTSLRKAPSGLDAIVAMFGQPGSAAASAGRVNLPAPLKLGWQNAYVSRVACHVEMEGIFAAVFGAIYDRGLWKLIRTYDGIYNDRVTTGGTKKSTHAWGIAVDLNASTNRYGTAGDMDPKLIRVFEEHGFLHLKHDPMHFQFARGY
ncbi:MAG: SH3 domain-containing protein [Pigmentiphaga sp.]|nr:SH3 domain-containing protein [Pigmentiphaga sp.]